MNLAVFVMVASRGKSIHLTHAFELLQDKSAYSAVYDASCHIQTS